MNIKHFPTRLDCTEWLDDHFGEPEYEDGEAVHLGSTVDVNNWPPVHRWGIRFSSGEYLTVEEVEV